MTDAYETKFMEGDSLFREKTVSRGGFAFLSSLSLALASLSPILYATLPPDAAWAALLPLPSALITGACAVLFVSLRVAVTRSHVQVQFGLAGPKIPVERITRTSIEAYSWTEWGGWGVKARGKGQWAYSTPAAGQRGVRIEHLDEHGTPCVTWVSAKDPERLAEAIDRARSGGGYRDAPKVRVELEAEQAEHVEQAAESERRRTK